jgi:hypothetical protein
VTFVLLYLYSVGNIVIALGADLAFGRPIPGASVLSDWPSKMRQPTAPFVWEPVAAVYLTRSVTLFVSVPNSLLALLLGTLVGLNMAVAIGRARIMAGQAGGGYMSGFFSSLPALLTGFTCCVLTVILALGSLAAGFSVAAIAVAPYFLPLAVIALVTNLLWSLRQLSCALRTTGTKNRVQTFVKYEQKIQRGGIIMRSDIMNGIAAGLAGGVVFGLMMQMMTAPTPDGGRMPMMAMVAQVVGSDSIAVGWIYHLFNSAVIGGLFGWLLGARAHSSAPALAWGAAYGFVWWILGGLILMPVLLGMPAFAPLMMEPMRMVAFGSLVGHVIYGVILGGGFAMLAHGLTGVTRRV